MAVCQRGQSGLMQWSIEKLTCRQFGKNHCLCQPYFEPMQIQAHVAEGLGWSPKRPNYLTSKESIRLQIPIGMVLLSTRKRISLGDWRSFSSSVDLRVGFWTPKLAPEVLWPLSLRPIRRIENVQEKETKPENGNLIVGGIGGLPSLQM